MADQLYEDVVFELSFNIEDPQAVQDSASFDDTLGFSPDMLARALDEYFEGWGEQSRLLPKSGSGRGSTYVFRKPTALDQIVLVESTYFATNLFLKNIAELVKVAELGDLRDLIEWESVEIVDLRFGCAKGSLYVKAKAVGGVITVLAALATIATFAIDWGEKKDPGVYVQAKCTTYLEKAHNLAVELSRTIDRYPENWDESGNEECVALRKKVLNYFPGVNLEPNGKYDDATMDAERIVALSLGIRSAEPKDLYPLLVERLQDPEKIVVLYVPRR